jgi:hypothetical protein
LALAVLIPIRAEIVDRIAVSVDNDVVTTSDIDREIRVTAFQNGKPPDFSPAARRAAADRLVEQQLIRRELETRRYPMPTAADAASDVEKFIHTRFKDAADYNRALAAAGLAAQDVSGQFLWERALLDFVDARFRLGVQVTDQQVQDYFDKVVKPAAEAAHPGAAVSLEDYRAQIEQTLAGPLVDRQLDDWLKQVRQRANIVYHDEAFQ